MGNYTIGRDRLRAKVSVDELVVGVGSRIVCGRGQESDMPGRSDTMKVYMQEHHKEET